MMNKESRAFILKYMMCNDWDFEDSVMNSAVFEITKWSVNCFTRGNPTVDGKATYS